jgi:hypothetical protein
MTNELKQIYLEKVSELLDKPITDAKIQIDYHYDEVPTIRYDITERIMPKVDGLTKGATE